MKKRRLVSILAMLLLAFALTACGGSSQQNGGSSGNGNSEGNSEERSETTDDADMEESDNKEDNKDNNTDGSVKYETFEELSSFDYFYNMNTAEKLYYNPPAWWYKQVPGGNAYKYSNKDSFIIAIANEETEYDNIYVYDGEIENILDTVYMEFVNAVDSAQGADYAPEEIDLNTITEREVVTLPCGVEALKWQGTLLNSWRDEEPYVVYGYTFVYQNMNVTFACQIDLDEVETEEEKVMMKDLVDKMVRTVRPTKE